MLIHFALGRYNQRPSPWLEDEFWIALHDSDNYDGVVRTAEEEDAMKYPEGVW